jgi:hypothetical protein
MVFVQVRVSLAELKSEKDGHSPTTHFDAYHDELQAQQKHPLLPLLRQVWVVIDLAALVLNLKLWSGASFEGVWFAPLLEKRLRQNDAWKLLRANVEVAFRLPLSLIRSARVKK